MAGARAPAREGHSACRPRRARDLRHPGVASDGRCRAWAPGRCWPRDRRSTLILTALDTPLGTEPRFSPLAIAADRCKACELCVTACPHHCLALDATVVNPLGYHPVRLVDPDACTSCVLCARVCPDAVFTVFAPPRTARP